MYGDGRLFQRGRIWWIAYCRSGKEYRESSRSTDEQVARELLNARMGMAKRESLTVYQLARCPELVETLPRRDLEMLYSDCMETLNHLRVRLKK